MFMGEQLENVNFYPDIRKDHWSH